MVKRAKKMSPGEKDVSIKAAKGRPMLSWVGKRPLARVPAYPAQHIETFDPTDSLHGPPHPNADPWPGWPSEYPRGGLLFHGDNKEVLAHLLANGFRGKVRLVYIDPPFGSGADYVRQVTLRGRSATSGSSKIDGEGYSLGEQMQYTDIWANDNYLQFMYERLLMLRELLSMDGSLYLHCDWHKSAHLRLLLDEVFGTENCVNEIIWKRTSARSDSSTFNHIHDAIFLYAKGVPFLFNEQFVDHDKAYIDRYYSYREADGRRFATIDATQSGLRRGSSGEPWRGFNPAAKGNHWKFATTELDRLDAEGRIYWPPKEGGWPRLKSFLDEVEGAAMQSIWSDITAVNSQAEERQNYRTQKPEALLSRIIRASSNPGDLVLDCFVGSGTTSAVAQKLGRRWIGCDINRGAIQITAKRLQGVVSEQVQNGRLVTAGGEPPPAQTAFTVWRVNDYDLQIQHNEAVNLASDFIGVERLRSDAYFDGTLGETLVKIVPFNHPLTPLDLEETKRELDARPDEDRGITMVCLGVELAAQSWLEDWNRLRRGKSAVNRIDVIELRADPRYGGIIRHEPAVAKVRIDRVDYRIEVEILEFVSPTIIQRLEQQAGFLKPQIDDWRAMVDSVSIDPTYDGEVFNIALVDVPEKKSDVVVGRYDLEAPKAETTVAVKIIDMLGEEVLMTKVI